MSGFPADTGYEYDKDGRLQRVTRPDGQAIDYLYDFGGRLKQIDAPGESVQFDYDTQSGQLAEVTSAQGESVQFSYDGSLPTAHQWSGSVTGEVSVTRDDDFKAVARRVNGSHRVDFTYDDDGLLTGAGPMTLSRDPDHGGVSDTSVGRFDTATTHNDFGEARTFTATDLSGVVYEVDYVRDDAGRIAQKTVTTATGTTTFAYGYDLQGRLTDVMADGQPRWHYEYDADGNRTLFEDYDTGTSEAGTYDDQDRLLTYAQANYTFNDAGELLEKDEGGPVTSYDYDAFGNLDRVDLPGGTAIEYATDPLGRRIARYVDGQFDRGWLYKDSLNPVAEIDASGDVVSRFVYAERPHVPSLIHSKKSGTWRWYRIVTDQLGSPRLVVDADTGHIVQRMHYSPFGRVLEDTNPGFQPFGFAGGLYDADMDLVRFGARDYDAQTGRWTVKDPVLFAGGDSNLFAYVANNPVSFVDPDGLWAVPLILVGITGLTGGYIVGRTKRHFRIRRRAQQKAKDMNFPGDPDMGPRNAFQHCYGACLESDWTPDWAIRLGSAIDEKIFDSGRTTRSQDMDHHNNCTGAGISGNSCANSCMDTLISGKLCHYDTSHYPSSCP